MHCTISDSSGRMIRYVAIGLFEEEITILMKTDLPTLPNWTEEQIWEFIWNFLEGGGDLDSLIGALRELGLSLAQIGSYMSIVFLVLGISLEIWKYYYERALRILNLQSIMVKITDSATGERNYHRAILDINDSKARNLIRLLKTDDYFVFRISHPEYMGYLAIVEKNPTSSFFGEDYDRYNDFHSTNYYDKDVLKNFTFKIKYHPLYETEFVFLTGKEDSPSRAEFFGFTTSSNGVGSGYIKLRTRKGLCCPAVVESSGGVSWPPGW